MKSLALSITTDKPNLTKYLQSILEVIFFQRSFGSLRPLIKQQFDNVTYAAIDPQSDINGARNTDGDDGGGLDTVNELERLNQQIDKVLGVMRGKLNHIVLDQRQDEHGVVGFGDIYLNYYVLKSNTGSSSASDSMTESNTSSRVGGNEGSGSKNNAISTWSDVFNEDKSTTRPDSITKKKARKLESDIDIFEQFIIKVFITSQPLEVQVISLDFERNVSKILEWCNNNKNHIPNLTNLNILPFDYQLGFIDDSGSLNGLGNGQNENEKGDYNWKGFIKNMLK